MDTPLPSGLVSAVVSLETEIDLRALDAVLASHRAADPRALARQTEFRAALGREGALERGLPEHLTASAMIVHPVSGRALLIHHPRFQRWQQPGGHADGDSNLARVAIRETLEETGLSGLLLDPVPIDLDRHEHQGDRIPVAHAHLDVRFLLIDPRPGQVETPVSPEGHELAWMDLGELAQTHPEPSLRRLAGAAITRLG